MKTVRGLAIAIIGVVAIAILAFALGPQNEQSVSDADARMTMVEEESDNSKFIYFTTCSSPVLSEDEIESANLLVVKSVEELQRVVGATSSLEILLIDPVDVADLERSWLRAVYEQGVVIAALDTPISTLAPKVGLTPEVDELRPKHEPSDIGVTAVYMTTVGETGRTMRQHSELYPNFESMFTILKTFSDLNPYNRPPSELLPGTTPTRG